MSRINCSSLLVAVGLALCAGLTSCKDDDLASDDHYKTPDWLKGNAYEVLQKDANYSTFLRAIELSDYQDIVAGKSILTVIAPDNEAFSSFLAKHNCSSIEEYNNRDHEALNKLVGYHLMYYAFDWNKMVNFRPSDGDAASTEAKEVMAGCYYKHRTHCSDPIEMGISVKLEPNAESETVVNRYHFERYLPIFSNKLFETKEIDPVYNYTYFFPDTEWSNASNVLGSFNIANGRVKDNSSVITDNGYLYHVDHVIEPLGTIYEELSDNPNYSLFREIYDRYAIYEALPDDDEITKSLGFKVHLMRHGDLPDIALEWPVSNWQAITQLEMTGYNVFAPTNAAIHNFFNNFWSSENGYATIDDLDPKILEYFVNQSFSDSRFIVFPEEIKRGDVNTKYGTPINIDPDQVTDRKLCCNGTLYGMDHMEMPAIFSSVVGPAFQDSTYQTYLYALDASSTLLSLASNNTQFVTLMPSGVQLYNNEPARIRLYTSASGKELQQIDVQSGEYGRMGSGRMKALTEIHIAQNVGELKTTGTQVVATNSTFNYWFIKDGQITTNALFNTQLDQLDGIVKSPFVPFTPILNNGHAWSNGSSYSYGAESIFNQVDESFSKKLSIANDARYKYYMFAQLMMKAGLNAEDLCDVIGGNHYVVFIPTNEALIANLDKIPGCTGLTVTDGVLSSKAVTGNNKTNLANYLKQYFIVDGEQARPFYDYPYIGSTFKGVFNPVMGEPMQVNYTDSSITVGIVGSSKVVNVIPDYDCLPFAFTDGCMHFIDDVL